MPGARLRRQTGEASPCGIFRFNAVNCLRCRCRGVPGIVGSAQASPLNPTQTMTTLPDQIGWHQRADWPPNCNAQAKLFGDVDKAGLYYVLIKWFPGYMSGPHKYVTDRLCVIVSGTWW